jgi:predicted AAA+ superfamily ATPase
LRVQKHEYDKTRHSRFDSCRLRPQESNCTVLGARQVGKTSLLSELHFNKDNMRLLNCDNIDERLLLEARSSTELQYLLSPYETAFID